MQILADVGQWLFHVSPAALTLGIGAWTIQRLFIRRANAASFVDGIINELEVLKKDALDYWNIDPLEDVDKKCPVLEQKIKGSIISIGANISYLCEKYWNEKVSAELDYLHFDLADEATGGQFETAERKVEPLKYLEIVNAVNRLRSRLMMTKL